MKKWIFAGLLIVAFALAACSQGDDELPVTEGDPERGAEIFQSGVDNEAPPCSTCHQTGSGGAGFALGPSLVDIASKAETRVDGISAEDYIRQSILEPDAYEVSGFRVTMYPDYSDHLSAQDIADLIAYLLTL